MDIWLTKSRGRQFVGVLCPCVKMPVVTHYRLPQTAEWGCQRTSKCHQSAADVSGLFLSLSLCLLLYPDECFSESEQPPAATLKTRRNPPLLSPTNEQWCVRDNRRLTPTQCNNTRMHTGCLVDHHYRTLHSKCTFSWRTCSVFHFKCPLSLHFVLHKTIALKQCLLAFVCHLFGLFV